MTSVMARSLRRDPTEAEKALWRLLHNRSLGGSKFRRQCPIGRYVADFACLELKLIVEADGGQHAASETDAARTTWLKSRGFRVLRFWNRDILDNPEGVASAILRGLEDARSPPPHPAAGAATLCRALGARKPAARKGRGLT